MKRLLLGAASARSETSSAADSLRISRTELSQVYCAHEPQVDIVLVHGLNGHPQKTWTAKNGVFWPLELLPTSLGEVPARILVWGYNADVYAFGGRSANADYIHDHAMTMVTNLDANRFRNDATQRPIIFVCHSLGGILVKRALNYSATLTFTNANTVSQRSIAVSTYGIIFLGTPHNGADPARWGSMLQFMCSALIPHRILDTQPQLVTALKTQSEALQNINTGFINIMPRYRICFFHEAVKTDFGVFQDFVVDQTSASPVLPGAVYAGIAANHSDMCKFESERAPGYEAVSVNLKRFALEAPARIATNWAQEVARQNQENAFRALELLPPGAFRPGMFDSVSSFGDANPQGGSSERLMSPDASAPSILLLEDTPHVEDISKEMVAIASTTQSAGPLFIVPAGFRPNSIFVGMQREMNELHEALHDPATRAKGSTCVLLWCLSGGGKSHLAREYIYTHREHFPGGVFWVRARSKEEIAHDFWTIAQKAALKDVKDPRTDWYEHDTEIFISTVRSWFEERHDWLLVFDGIAIDRDAEKSELQAFIPDSKNSSVILTSVDKSLAGSHRLLNPAPIKVLPLAEDEARQLLFRELRINEPSPTEIEKATDIVRKVDRLPLAIHAIGYRMKATGEPLARYHRTYYSGSKLREPFVEIMRDLERLGHVEARNLINVLCFFGRHVPFEMVNLGVRALLREGVEVRTSEAGARADLNTTLGILIKYALVERNDPDDSASQGSHPSLIETIDILKMHSVVQSFLGDELRAAGILAAWLAHAVTLFCSSFAEADGRIKRQDGDGLVRDYREYEVHGKRLMEHVMKNRMRSRMLESVEMLLLNTLERVEDEIRKRTPASSREAVHGHAGQTSIFDRTSSTSDNGPDTPTRRSSLPLVPILGFSKGPIESPSDIRDASPHPVIVPPSPLLPIPYEDDGYLSDTERVNKPPTARTGSAQASKLAEKPSRADTTDPRVHRTVSRGRDHRPRDSVSPWRSVAGTTAAPTVSRITADGKRLAGSPEPGAAAAPSEAEASLAAFRELSSRFSLRGRRTDRQQLARASRSDTAAQLAYRPQISTATPTGLMDPTPSTSIPVLGPAVELPQANDRASSLPVLGPISPPIAAAGPVPMARGGSNGSAQSIGRRDLNPTAHMALVQSLQQAMVPASVPAPTNPMRPRSPDPGLPTSRHSSPGARGAHPLASSDPELPGGRTHISPYPVHWDPMTPGFLFDPASRDGRSALLRSKLSLDALVSGPRDETERTPKMSSSMGNLPPVSEYVLSSYAPNGPAAIAVPGRKKVGYSSEPMSRETSGQSMVGAESVTGTEPSRFPPRFSPYGGASPLMPQSRAAENARIRQASSLRGTPMVPGRVSLQEATPRYASDQDFAAMGGWIMSPSPSALGVDVGSRPSSGPGIAAGGTLTRFGEHASTEMPATTGVLLPAVAAGLEPPPSSVAEKGFPPYPAVSQMPHPGDELGEELLGRTASGRPRGLTSPTRSSQAVGLGLGLDVGSRASTPPSGHGLVRVGSVPHIPD